MALAALLAKCSGMTMVYPLLSLSFFLSVPLGEVNAWESFLICSKNQGHHERRGALGYIRNRKTEGKNHPKPQNRKKIRPKPKTAYKTVKNRYNGDKWGIQSKLN